MEDEKDEFGELYTDVLPPPFSYPTPLLQSLAYPAIADHPRQFHSTDSQIGHVPGTIKLDFFNNKITSEDREIVVETRVSNNQNFKGNVATFGVSGKGTNELSTTEPIVVPKLDEKCKIELENEEEKDPGDETLVESKDLSIQILDGLSNRIGELRNVDTLSQDGNIVEFINCDFEKNFEFAMDFEAKGEETETRCSNVEGLDAGSDVFGDDLEGKECGEGSLSKQPEYIDIDFGIHDLDLHPMLFELLNGTCTDDVNGKEENEINMRVLDIASDCGIGIKNDEDSDSDGGLNIILNNDDYSRWIGVNEKGVLGNGKGLTTGYDDHSNQLEPGGTSIHPGGSPGHSYSFCSASPVADHGKADRQLSGLGRPAQANSSSEDVVHTRLDFFLPSYMTVFDINIDYLKEKRWRRPGVVLSDFFNFGLDELEWKNYCGKMGRLCLEGSTGSKIISESDRPDQPVGRSIQVQVGMAERFPSFETSSPWLRNSDTIIEIGVRDDSPNDANSQSEDFGAVAQWDTEIYNDFLCSSNSRLARICKNICGNSIRPFPLDSSHQRYPDFEQFSGTVDKDSDSKVSRAGKRDAIAGGTMGPEELWPTATLRDQSSTHVKTPMLSYPPRHDLKDQSWRIHVTDLILKYGKSNNEYKSLDYTLACRQKDEEYTRSKYRKKKPDNGRFREKDKLKQQRAKGSRLDNQIKAVREQWSTKSCHSAYTDDSACDSPTVRRGMKKEGEGIMIKKRQGSKRKYVFCASYCKEKVQEGNLQ